MTKRLRGDEKNGGPTMHTNKNLLTNCFFVCKLDYFRKKIGVKDIIF